MMEGDAGVVPEQYTMGVERALGLTGCAGRVDHHGRIVGRGVEGIEIVRGACQR